MNWIPLRVKTSDRVNSQLGPVAPVALRVVQKRPLWIAALLFSSWVPNFIGPNCFPKQHRDFDHERRYRHHCAVREHI